MRYFALWLVPGLLLAQAPRVGVIEVYGVRKVPAARVRQALGVREGDALPPSKGALEERLERVPGVVRALVVGVCCDGDRAALYIGIEEKGAPRLLYHAPPESMLALPDAIAIPYRQFLGALERAVLKGAAGEDLTLGYSLLRDPDCREFQERFRAFAEGNVGLLRDVLRRSSFGDQRAIAAYVIGYAPKQPGVVDDLIYAMRDPEESVRNNAVRSLGAIAVLAAHDPDPGLRIPPNGLIDMLQSLVWTDRNKAALALLHLTEDRRPETLEQLRVRALPALLEMAQWKTPGHALPAFILLGRIGGLPAQDVLDAWAAGDRETIILKVLRKLNGKRR